MESGKDFQNIASGDRRAFEALVDTYQVALVAFAFDITGDRGEAEDIVQDVFVRVWLKRREIEFGSDIRNFLYLTTRYYAYNRLRAARSLESHLAKIGEGAVPDPLDSMVEHEVARILHETINSLPPRTAEVMRLTLRGLKQEEIGVEMGMALTSVKTLKSAGIRKLREMLRHLMALFA